MVFNPHKVLNCAFSCVSFVPQAKHHATVLPALMRVMDDFNSPRVQVRVECCRNV